MTKHQKKKIKASVLYLFSVKDYEPLHDNNFRLKIGHKFLHLIQGQAYDNPSSVDYCLNSLFLYKYNRTLKISI